MAAAHTASLWVPAGHTFETVFRPVLFDPMSLAREGFLRAAGGEAAEAMEVARRRFQLLPGGEGPGWLPPLSPQDIGRSSLKG